MARQPKANLVRVNNLNDLMFPVQMIEQTDFECLKDCKFEVFVYPYTKEIETEIKTNLGLPLNSDAQSTDLVIVDQIDAEIAECFEVTYVTDYSRKIRVNVCSDQYRLIPNIEIFPAIEQILLQNNIKYSVTYEMSNFSKFYVKYTIEDQRFAYDMGNGDFVKPVISVMHSYNGQVNYKIVLGWYRLVCSNGLTIAIEDMKKYNLSIVGKHTEKIEQSLNRLENMLSIFDQNNPTLANVFSRFNCLNSVPVYDLKKAIETTLEKTGITAVDNKNLNSINYVYNRINSEMIKLGLSQANNWLLYNGINFYIYDNTLTSTAPELRADKDQKVFEYLLKLSKDYNPITIANSLTE